MAAIQNSCDRPYLLWETPWIPARFIARIARRKHLISQIVFINHKDISLRPFQTKLKAIPTNACLKLVIKSFQVVEWNRFLINWNNHYAIFITWQLLSIYNKTQKQIFRGNPFYVWSLSLANNTKYTSKIKRKMACCTFSENCWLHCVSIKEN